MPVHGHSGDSRDPSAPLSDSCWWTASRSWKPERIVGIKNVTVNEPFFNGHFPEFPVMPGVLIIEAMAQVAGVLVLSQIRTARTNWCCWRRVEEAKFRKPVRPGDQLRIEMKVVKRKATHREDVGRRDRGRRAWWRRRPCCASSPTGPTGNRDADSSDRDRRSRRSHRGISAEIGPYSMIGPEVAIGARTRADGARVHGRTVSRSAKTTSSFRIRPSASRRRI